MHWGIRSRRDPFAGGAGRGDRRACRRAASASPPCRPRGAHDRHRRPLHRPHRLDLRARAAAAALCARLMDWAEDAYAWLDFALFGLFGIAVAWAVCRPLEAWRPVEPLADRGAVRTDMLYTFLSRLGLLPLLAFVLLASVQAAWEGWLTEAGLLPPTLEELVPVLRDHPVAGLRRLCRHPRLRRVLAAPGAARLPLVVGAACHPSCAAADDLLDRRPQPRAGRRAGGGLVRRASRC